MCLWSAYYKKECSWKVTNWLAKLQKNELAKIFINNDNDNNKKLFIMHLNDSAKKGWL